MVWAHARRAPPRVPETPARCRSRPSRSPAHIHSTLQVQLTTLSPHLKYIRPSSPCSDIPVHSASGRLTALLLPP
eukprot:65859-Prymnesium_polylepis.1